jgi:peptide/nickel transport system permease protein
VTVGVALGFSHSRIMFSHIFPNIAAPLIVESTFSIARNMITEASLSFLGIGVQHPAASWGNMLNNTQSMTVLFPMRQSNFPVSA